MGLLSRLESKSGNKFDSDRFYSRAVTPPIYNIKGDRPHINSLCNNRKVAELLVKIRKSNISDDEKKFLTMAAYRHYVFDYSLIAEYYSHANPDMQELMEDSALVIIDIDDAIRGGYVKLSDRLSEYIQESKEFKKNEETKTT